MKQALLCALLAITACHKSTTSTGTSSTTPAPAAGSAAQPDACKHPTCGECVSEGGCFWHTDSNTCTFGLQGCTEGSNCVNNVNNPCP